MLWYELFAISNFSLSLSSGSVHLAYICGRRFPALGHLHHNGNTLYWSHSLLPVAGVPSELHVFRQRKHCFRQMRSLEWFGFGDDCRISSTRQVIGCENERPPGVVQCAVENIIQVQSAMGIEADSELPARHSIVQSHPLSTKRGWNSTLQFARRWQTRSVWSVRGGCLIMAEVLIQDGSSVIRRMAEVTCKHQASLT